MSQEQRRPRPQPEPRGANVNSTLSVIVAVLSVLLGFFILRDIRGDGGGTVSAPAVTETTVAEGSVDTLPAVPTTAAGVEQERSDAASDPDGRLLPARQ
jgi:hypothetical protein